MKIVFGDDIVPWLSSSLGVRANHPHLVSLVPEGTDQVQRGNGGAVVGLTQYVADHSYFHNISLLYLFTHSNVRYALERVTYFRENYKSPRLQNDKNSAKLLSEKGQNAKNDRNNENAIDKWKRLLYHGENKSKGNEEEQYLNPYGAERTRLVRVSATNSANLTSELRTENPNGSVGGDGILR